MTNGPATSAVVNPFPGLRPFREDEEHLFFGRESQVDTMVDKLARTRFLAVVGTSGSGKSSLVNCGLRPALHRGLMVSAGTSWCMVQCRPGSNPVRALARALASENGLFGGYQPEGVSLAEIVEATLRLSKLGLADIYEQAQSTGRGNLLVVVDQFEELFRYRGMQSASARTEQDRSQEAMAFVNLLLEARAQPTFPIYIVLTMRSDFLGDCAQFPGLAEAINDGQYLVPRLTREERRAAIAGPVGVGGGTISPVLLTRLVNDVGDNPDQLSILQHALNRTWAGWQHEGRGDGPLSLSHYESIGTMAHALDRHAEKAYRELAGERQQNTCEKVFKTLTDRGTDARGIRRPTTLGALCAIAGASLAEATEVMDVFRKPSRSFLMPPLPEVLEADTVIDISHESLMRVWERLTVWADEEARSAQLYRRLSETATLHARGQAGLWSNPDLQFALDWRTKAKPSAAWAQIYGGGFDAAMSFLSDSKAADEAERVRRQQNRETEQLRRIAEARREEENKAKEEQLRTQTRARDLERRLKRVALVLAALALGVASFAWISSREATRQKELAIVRLFATKAAIVSAQSDRFLAAGALLAAESYRRQPNTEAQGLLAEALALMPEKLGAASHPRARRVALSQNGRYFASYGADSTARLWSSSDGERVAEWLHAAPVTALAFSPDGEALATGTDTGEIKVWLVAQARPIAEFECGKSVKAISLASGIGPLVAVCGDIHVWRPEKQWLMATLRQIRIKGLPTVPDTALVSIDQEGSRLAIADASHVGSTKLFVVDCTSGQTIASSDIPSSTTALALDPEKARLATAGQAGLVTVWSYRETGSAIGEMSIQQSAGVRDLTFSSTGDALIVAGNDGVTKVWSTAAFREIARIGQDSAMISVAAAGNRLAGVNEDGTIRVWLLAGMELSDTLTKATFSAAGRYLIARGLLSVRLWDVGAEKQSASWRRLRLPPFDGYPTAISPDHQLIAFRDRNGSNVVFTVRHFSEGRVLERVWSQKISAYVSWAEFSPDSKHVAAILQPPGEDGRNLLVSWDAETGSKEREWNDLGSAQLFRFSADSSRIAVAVDDRIVLLDVATGRVTTTLTGIKNVAAIALSPDGRRLAASESPGEPTSRHGLGDSDDESDILEGQDLRRGRVSVWSLTDGRLLASFEHPGRVSPMVFDPDSEHLLTASSDGSARIWNLDPVQEILRMAASSTIYAVAFRADSRIAVATRTRLASYFWKPDDLLREACRRVNRNLTRSEWERFLGTDIPYRKTCPSLD